MEDFLELLGVPHRELPVVHVAGTKGKGSTVAMLGGVLTAAGYRVGIYTSPHLEDPRERIAINGVPCPEEDFLSILEEIMPAVEKIDQIASAKGYFHGPTYFEILTALAFAYFHRQHVDLALLEVGLGGRLDATNVCRPLICVITSISLDHMDQLGSTVESIAREKAGIIKPGIITVSGVLDPAARRVIEAVSQREGSPLLQLGQHFCYSYKPAPITAETASAQAKFDYLVVPEIAHGVCLPSNCEAFPGAMPTEFAYATRDSSAFERVYCELPLPLMGEHQAANAAVALTVLLILKNKGWIITDEAIRRGFEQLRWPARIEVISRRPTVIVDVAHNAASAAALVQTLAESFKPARKSLIFAASKDKDIRGMLRHFLPAFDRLFLTEYRSNPRVMPASDLASIAGEIAAELAASRHAKMRLPSDAHAGIPPGLSLLGGKILVLPDPVAAWQQTWRESGPTDLICVTGSFFLAAELRRIMLRDIALSAPEG